MADTGIFATTAEVQRKAGANASATSKAEAYTNQYILDAEHFIVALCRYDFIANFATLNTNTKHLLCDAASNMAAIYVISYDMSGFTTRTEAENMVNILWARWNQAIKLLQDQKTVTYMQ